MQTIRKDFSGAEPAWFCVRTQQKREHIAGRHLKQLPGLELFSPRLRSRKLTRRGPVWFTESLFPNYLFARFALEGLLEEVKFTAGVSHVLNFGDRYPAIPESVIEELRKNFDEEHLQLSPEIPERGEKVTVADGRFFGWEATVLRVLPARQRIQVLLDMLGQSTTVELSLTQVVPGKRPLPNNLVAGMTASA